MLVAAYIGFGNSVVRYHLPYVLHRKDTVKVKYIYRRESDRIIPEELAREKLYDDRGYIFTSDLDMVLSDAEVNLIVINTPHETHVMYAKMALDYGKNVLVEKPIALSYNETKEILSYAREKNLILMPNHNRRYDTDFVAVKDAIATGKLGEIIEVESHYDYFRPQPYVGGTGKFMKLQGLGIHTIDQIIALLGIPDSLVYDVRSLFYDSGADDYYDIDFFYPNKKAIMKTSMIVKSAYPRFTVHGRNGSFLKYGGAHNSSHKTVEPVELDFSDVEDQSLWGTLQYVDTDGLTHTEKIPSKETDYGIIYDHLYESIVNGKPKLISDEEVLAAMRIVEEAIKHAR